MPRSVSTTGSDRGIAPEVARQRRGDAKEQAAMPYQTGGLLVRLHPAQNDGTAPERGGAVLSTVAPVHGLAEVVASTLVTGACRIVKRVAWGMLRLGCGQVAVHSAAPGLAQTALIIPFPAGSARPPRQRGGVGGTDRR
ncbi:hypothetical protein [Streptomyces ipomoeae]|uniref:hypothetical protein n=1 Tax=Streptomyces ipomoeae TaxID=103232 RepID=UPI00131A2770|nr:hypothetical protein [Streptomyces ipomoeae]MDX2694422.1 hypothetical protein [Streptomyces ipomoeae]MDX2837908.1 hypothetical protein [Streptomyces ipomoeae]